MNSNYFNFTESSNSSSFSTLTNQHNIHHMHSFPNSHINDFPLLQNPLYHSPYIPYPTSPSNFGFIGNQIISPPNYYTKNTISYNNNKTNNFVQGEPVPIHEDRKNKCCAHGCSSYISDILLLLREMKGLNLDKKLKVKNEEESEDSENSKGIEKKNNKKGKKKKKKQNEEEKQRKLEVEKWWKLTRDFIYLTGFFFVAKKYSMQYTQIRNNFIELRTHSLEEEIFLLEDWVITLEEPCWDEFEVFIDENCAFEKGDSKNKIRRESLKIIGVIKKYVEYLILGTSKLTKIPERIQQILYEFIKNGAYFPKKYLSTFQICRLNFEFYGSTANLTDEQSAMILAFLLLSVVSSQRILCNIRETVKKFRNYANVIISTKYVASVLHYLTIETFKKDIESLDDIYALFNYYRNYHLNNDFIEKKENKDISKDDYLFEGLPNIDEDEYQKYFISREEIEDFFSTNNAFVETFKNYIYIWAVKLAKLIREKFSKKDPNLLPRKPMSKPPDKIYNGEEEKEKETQKSEEKEDNEKKNEIKEEKNKKKGKNKEKIEDKGKDKEKNRIEKEIKIEEEEEEK